MGKTIGLFRADKGTPKELRDSGRDQLFTQRDHIPPRPHEAQALSLELVLERLHDSGINAGLQTFAFTGLTAWIGDAVNGQTTEATLDSGGLGWTSAGTVAQWLHDTKAGSNPMANTSGYVEATDGVEIPSFQPFKMVPFPPREQRITERIGCVYVPSLETVLKDLHDSEINAGVQTFHPAGLRVWIGDQMNGLEVSAHIGPGDGGWLNDGTAALWLHEAAVKLHPTSEYAKHFIRRGGRD